MNGIIVHLSPLLDFIFVYKTFDVALLQLCRCKQAHHIGTCTPDGKLTFLLPQCFYDPVQLFALTFLPF